MKKLFGYLLLAMIISCKLRPDNSMTSAAAIHFSGVFITEHISSIPTLHVKGSPSVTKDSGDIYTVSGLVEGYSSYNVPFIIEHFSEKLHYLGGNPNERNSWECVAIYIGNKKVK